MGPPLNPKIVSEYDKELPQSQTAENPWHREEEPHNKAQNYNAPLKLNNTSVKYWFLGCE